MGIKEKIEQLRSRPEEERKKLLSLSLIVGSLIVVFFWIATFGMTYEADGGKKSASAVEAVTLSAGSATAGVESERSPMTVISSFGQMIKTLFSSEVK